MRIKNEKMYRLYRGYRRNVVPECLFLAPDGDGDSGESRQKRKNLSLSAVGRAGIFAKGKRINIQA